MKLYLKDVFILKTYIRSMWRMILSETNVVTMGCILFDPFRDRIMMTFGFKCIPFGQIYPTQCKPCVRKRFCRVFGWCPKIPEPALNLSHYNDWFYRKSLVVKIRQVITGKRNQGRIGNDTNFHNDIHETVPYLDTRNPYRKRSAINIISKN